MKTTIEIPDSLFGAVKKLARRRKTTMKAVIVDALRRAMRDDSDTQRFRLRDCSVEGDGPVQGVDPTKWEQIRGMIYDGRGG